MQPPSVPIISSVKDPVAIALCIDIIAIGLAGRIGQDFLHIAIAQLGIGFQHQSNDPGDHGGRGGGAVKLSGVVAVIQFIRGLRIRVIALRAGAIGGDNGARNAKAGIAIAKCRHQ